MTPTSSGGHRGLARQLRSLFDDPPPPGRQDAGDAADVAWVSETARPMTAGAGGGERSGPLAEAVDGYVLAGPGAEGTAGAALDRAIEEARRGPASQEMADAVESLLQYSVRQDEALDRARSLTTPGVAALLVRRLIEMPDGDRKSRLLQQLPELGDSIRDAALDTFRVPPPGGLRERGSATGPLSLLATMTRSTPGMLEELVQDPDWRVVGAVVSITADRGGDEALQILALALEHSHPRVRRQALSALSKLGGQEAGGLALSKVDDPDREVRVQAARTVGDLNVGRAVGPLVERLRREEHPEVLAAILRALDLIGGPEAERVLHEAATDGDPAIREWVAEHPSRRPSDEGPAAGDDGSAA